MILLVLPVMRLMIDTRKAVKELRAVGFSEDQADLVASLFSSTIPWEELVTKEYLSKELEAIRGVIARQSTSQIKWIVSMQALILGIALTVSRLL